ncbi:hypothetical protein NFI96_012727, partial [Prochilodus magdalenae]
DCHGVTQNGSGSSSVTSPALVLVETPNESVCGGTEVTMNGCAAERSFLNSYTSSQTSVALRCLLTVDEGRTDTPGDVLRSDAGVELDVLVSLREESFQCCVSDRGQCWVRMSEQFNCENCKESLYGRKYIQVDDVPHCVPCYDRLYSNICQGCKELIGHNSRECLDTDVAYIQKLVQYIPNPIPAVIGACGGINHRGLLRLVGLITDLPPTALQHNRDWSGTLGPTLPHVFNTEELYYDDRHYHEECFRCSRCERSLADEPFTCQDEALLCNECYCSEFSSKCVACNKTIMPGSRKLEYSGCAWHEECFVCRACQQSLGSQAFIPDKDDYYDCKAAVAKDRLRSVLVQGGVTYRDEPWHRECFLCTGCKAPLAGQPFTSQGENPYCVKCFSSLYAQKCSACNKPITGFGDGKYVSFEDRQWHQMCFKCSECSVSLVGAGFFPQGAKILCKDCNDN